MQNLSVWESTILSLIIPLMFILLPQTVRAQSKSYPEIAPKERINTERQQKRKETTFFPDEYSGLDEKGNSQEAQLQSKELNDAIEQARQKYFQALILVQKRDKKRAIKYFEEALNKLNKLLSFPNIENNADFAELAQSILNDYKEVAANSTTLLDENSPVFAINELLNKEIEKFDEIDQISLDSIYAQYERQNPHKIVKTQNYGQLPKPPDSLQIAMTDNPIVEKSLEFLTRTTGKRFYTRWLERSTRWFPMMLRIAEEENMPKEILYLSMIESGMNPNAVSSAKAVGLWQFMRATGLDYELNGRGSIFVDERRDPEKATRAAMRHLRDLYQEFGDWHLALAAYNCGAGCVSRAIKKTEADTINYWTVRERLPKETRGYVPKFISAAKIAMDPESYGFKIDSLNFHDEYQYDVYALNEPVNLDAIAKSAGVSIEIIKELNPELLFNCTPPDMLPYSIKIPKGSLNTFAINFGNLSNDDKSAFLTHIVNSKETIRSIANRYDIEAEDLVAMNDLESTRTRIRKGQELRIPVTAIIKSEEIARNSSKAEPKNIAQATETYSKHKIKSGETLFSIAKDYGMEVARLRKINGIDRGDKLIIGTNLNVEGEQIASNKSTKPEAIKRKETQKQKENSESIILHKVRRGETLSEIADKFGVSNNEIKDWNNLRRDRIKVGQVLTIKADEEPQITKNKSESSKDKKNQIHKVVSGESLATISKKYGVSESDLKKWNDDVINGNTIFIGTRLKLYDSKTKTSESLAKDKPKYYKVKRGDTLSEIAKKFGVTTKSIRKHNNNISERNLQAGVNIRVK
ncbi:MAG TPA: LysM peptidoglycan-binding domain-containing protein [Candidatus Kapabacteria bacterium]|nr:LysM peptidoglycan-binding domain-containing protein [Candidatus Kapabacteria bacterium]